MYVSSVESEFTMAVAGLKTVLFPASNRIISNNNLVKPVEFCVQKIVECASEFVVIHAVRRIVPSKFVNISFELLMTFGYDCIIPFFNCPSNLI